MSKQTVSGTIESVVEKGTIGTGKIKYLIKGTDDDGNSFALDVVLLPTDRPPVEGKFTGAYKPDPGSKYNPTVWSNDFKQGKDLSRSYPSSNGSSAPPHPGKAQKLATSVEALKAALQLCQINKDIYAKNIAEAAEAGVEKEIEAKEVIGIALAFEKHLNSSME